jgi:hypothetical protein
MPKTVKSKSKEIEGAYYLNPHYKEREGEKYNHFRIEGFLMRGDFILSKDCEPLPDKIVLYPKDKHE